MSRMTVKDLKEILQSCLDDAIIIVNGHTGSDDFEDCYCTELTEVYEKDKREWNGRYSNYNCNNLWKMVEAFYIG